MRLLVFSSCLLAFLAYLVIERILLSYVIDKIPIRICITGTRGKSSVTRLVHAALNQNGIKTIGKTTGSRASLLLPNGAEQKIRRRGPQNILEQRRVLRRAYQQDVDAFVAEMMSIKPEYGYVESSKILRPTLIGMTRIAVDHAFEMGTTLQKVSQSIASSLPEEGKLVVEDGTFLEHVSQPLWKLDIGEASHSLQGDNGTTKKVLDNLNYWEFEENVHLALAIANHVGLSQKAAARGMSNAKPDFGALRGWRLTDSSNNKTIVAISAFAANDPHSTRLAFEKARKELADQDRRWVGMLNLRGDRANRTLQWRDAIKDYASSPFQRIFVIGDQAAKFKGMCGAHAKHLEATKSTDPKSLTYKVSNREIGGASIFGFGNIAGIGEKLIKYWAEEGDPL